VALRLPNDELRHRRGFDRPGRLDDELAEGGDGVARLSAASRPIALVVLLAAPQDQLISGPRRACRSPYLWPSGFAAFRPRPYNAPNDRRAGLHL
jgi:hypothetical protein